MINFSIFFLPIILLSIQKGKTRISFQIIRIHLLFIHKFIIDLFHTVTYYFSLPPKGKGKKTNGRSFGNNLPLAIYLFS